MTDEVDVLFGVRNGLHIGNYQVCVSDAQSLETSTSEQAAERDWIMYRAMVALGKHSTVNGEISSSSSTDLQAVKRLSVYLQKKSERASIVAEIKKLMDDGMSLDNPNVALMCATVLLHEESYDDALRCLHGKDSLECLALNVQTLLLLNRADVAKKELKKMLALDEDSTLSQLATAWVGLALGGDKLQESFYIFQELGDKYGHTSLLLNGQAAAYMKMNQFDEAEGFVQSAQEKDSSGVATLINTVSSFQYQGKTKEAQRALNELKDTFAAHPWTKQFTEKESEFDRLASQF